MLLIISYFDLLFYLVVGALVGSIPIIFGFLLSYRTFDSEKLSAYECGFEPFGNVRLLFNVRFYLIAILFIIFDLEVVFLFPWAVVMDVANNESFFCFLLFLSILTFGFFYEWKKGALEWE